MYAERETIAGLIARTVRHRTFADIAAALDSLGLWYARVDDYDDLLENAQVQHNETFREFSVNGETIKLLNHPLRYDGRIPDACTFALQVGADTRAVLKEAGFGDAEICDLLDAKVAFAPD